MDYIQALYVYEGQAMREQDWIGKDETFPLLLGKLEKLEFFMLGLGNLGL